MSEQLLALKAELIKNRHSNILWATFVAFGLAPVLGGVFILFMQSPGTLAKSSALSTKAQVMNFTPDWASYLGLLIQAIGVGGVMVFGFVASWLFGREYSDGTAKDLLALPVSRTKILHAKFVVYLLWCLALVLSNLLLGFLIGSLLQISTPENFSLSTTLSDYLITALLTVLLGPPIAFFAIWGKGYLAPLGFVALTLVFAQVIAATGYGYYFPWSVPGLYSGAGGEYKAQLNFISYSVLILSSVIGYLATVLYWNYTDQTR